MGVIVAKAPLRISLGGGGTDLPSYFREHEGFLVAGAIDRYVYILVHAAFNRIFQLKYSKLEETRTPSSIRHPIFREALMRYWDGDPLEITSIADVPAGTGLGSSGSFTVALLKALAQCRRTSTTPAQLAQQASEIEIDFLQEPVGKQDPYVAAHGGICAYTFHRDDTVTVEPLSLSGATHERLRNQMLLFYTGETRSASSVLMDQHKRSLAGDQEMIENLHRTKEMGFKSRQLLECGDLEGYAKLMNEHWQNKRSRSDDVTNAHIDRLYEIAMANGAIGGKLIGAGGGGFLLVYSAIPSLTREAMAGLGATEQPFDFEFGGASAQGLV
ncbi:MAG TPA: galactokinase [Acidimicrobiales bacterium]|nr:galactokinase [Acidimicrobiales bacterium]